MAEYAKGVLQDGFSVPNPLSKLILLPTHLGKQFVKCTGNVAQLINKSVPVYARDSNSTLALGGRWYVKNVRLQANQVATAVNIVDRV